MRIIIRTWCYNSWQSSFDHRVKQTFDTLSVGNLNFIRCFGHLSHSSPQLRQTHCKLIRLWCVDRLQNLCIPPLQPLSAASATRSKYWTFCYLKASPMVSSQGTVSSMRKEHQYLDQNNRSGCRVVAAVYGGNVSCWSKTRISHFPAFDWDHEAKSLMLVSLPPRHLVDLVLDMVGHGVSSSAAKHL